jgi:hypothetical protein
MNWKIVTKDVDPHDPKIKQLFDAAVAAAPDDYVKTDASGNNVAEDTVAMLPRKPIKGQCRLCGQIENLTKEHIPPKSSGNKQRHTNLTFDDWLRDKLEDNPEAKYTMGQGGIFGYTLCRSCNSLTGKLYGNEYKRWVELAKKKIDGFGSGIVPQLDSLIGLFGENFTFGSKEDGSVKPGSFVRQILSLMCSLSGSWDLAGRYPSIRRIILEQTTESLPQGMELGMFIFFGPRVRIHGPQLRIDAKTLIWRWVQEIAYPPFAFQFVIASNDPQPGLGLLIDNFAILSPGTEQYYSGLMEMGFGWSPYPGDYRSKAAILKDRPK